MYLSEVYSALVANLRLVYDLFKQFGSNKAQQNVGHYCTAVLFLSPVVVKGLLDIC